ncbi:MAG: hypothetical protein Q7S45_03150 [Candidatus Curtissbacteria bacterium]|nr:hypothetical protein [Candidatus Curtissbacteria bacterium]
MTKIVIKKLVWDKHNLEHIAKHNVTVDEAQEAIRNFIAHKIAKKGRYLAIGRSGSRLISLVVGRISTGVYYPVSVRDSSKKERKEIYEKEKI